MFILSGATYHTFDPWLDRAEEILLKGTGLTKRKSLVVVFRTNKVFLIPNGVIISLRQRSVTECAEEALLLRTGLHEACSLFLRSFDFRLVAGLLLSLDCFRINNIQNNFICSLLDSDVEGAPLIKNGFE